MSLCSRIDQVMELGNKPNTSCAFSIHFWIETVSNMRRQSKSTLFVIYIGVYGE